MTHRERQAFNEIVRRLEDDVLRCWYCEQLGFLGAGLRLYRLDRRRTLTAHDDCAAADVARGVIAPDVPRHYR